MSAPSFNTTAQLLSVPWIVMGTYERSNGDVDSMTEIVEAPLDRPPYAEDCLGAAGARRVIKGSIFPATYLLDIKPGDRRAFVGAFRAYQMWVRARMAGKAVADLVPGTDYHVAYMEQEFKAWFFGRTN
jgi:hypothetical protein